MSVRYDDREGVRWAVVTGPTEGLSLDALRGCRVVTEDDAFVRRLLAAGGTVHRRGHDYVFECARVPPQWADLAPPPPFSLAHGLDADALGPVKDAANPPGHPDHEAGMDHVADLCELLSGAVIGPNVPAATWQVSDADGPCGGIVVSERADPGTWVLDVFVHPRHQGRGLGALLLRRSLAGAAAAGYPAMGLVVTDGNPARAVYDRVGFRLRMSATNVDLPA